MKISPDEQQYYTSRAHKSSNLVHELALSTHIDLCTHFLKSLVQPKKSNVSLEPFQVIIKFFS